MAIKTLHKYLDNIINNEAEEKYRKIKLSNKAFQGRVNSQKGAMEFLMAIGWHESVIDNEPFLIYSGEIQTLVGTY